LSSLTKLVDTLVSLFVELAKSVSFGECESAISQALGRLGLTPA